MTDSRKPINVLLIEDDEGDALLFQRSLSASADNYQPQVCGSLSSALCWLESNHCDVILLDLSLPDSYGLDGIAEIHGRFSDVPIVMLTGFDDDRTALNALDRGAQDYLIKGETNPRELERTLRYAIQRQQIQNENRQLIIQLQNAARSDALTGVLNRHAMIEEFEQHWAQSQSTGVDLSCAILDIDFFKRINDQHGHLAGDEVLRNVAELIGGQARPGDFIARYGGEEFCVILVGANQQQATDWAERMRKALAAHPIDLAGEQIQVTASFGVAQRCQDTHCIEDLIDRADHALLSAKSAGRDRVCTCETPSGSLRAVKLSCKQVCEQV